ncbi:MAG: ABC transporter permease [Thermoanaerobaculia bacterium]
MSGAIGLALIAGTPLLLAVMGELVLQRGGVINIALEGMILGGAFGAAVGAAATGSAWGGVAGGVAGAAGPAIVFGLLVLWRGADQIVSGIALNLVVLGATGMLYREMNEANRLVASIPRFPSRGFGGIAVDPLLLCAWTIVPAVAFAILWRTRAGLRLRAAGENPASIALGGLRVGAYRGGALAFETILAGLAGAYLVLGLGSGFAENMAGGRGFIALAIVIFARWRVGGAVAAVALFAAAVALQYSAQAAGTGVPFHLLLGVPYVLTLLALIFVPGSVRAPAALGKS